MKRRNSNVDDVVETHLGLFGSPSLTEIAAAEERALRRLRGEAAHAPEAIADLTPSPGLVWKWRFALAAVAVPAIVVLVVRLPVVLDRGTTPLVQAVVETADGGLYTASGERMRPGQRVTAEEVVRTNGGTGAQLTLTDGSRVEMRSRSELSLDRAADGARIRLNRGGIIVTAADQRSGHLYVQTKDVTVSVVGTVFLVNAGEEGSRVAVIEGEVHVQQGATQKTLLPGEQVATNPLMSSPPVREAIAWSRNAAALLALLRQATVVPPSLHSGADPDGDPARRSRSR